MGLGLFRGSASHDARLALPAWLGALGTVKGLSPHCVKMGGLFQLIAHDCKGESRNYIENHT